jgi:hypothetical protein
MAAAIHSQMHRCRISCQIKQKVTCLINSEVLDWWKEIVFYFSFLSMDDLILDVNEPPSPTTLLIPEDYPLSFRNPDKLYAHPRDYLEESSPIAPQVFLYKKGPRSRIFLRISVRLEEEGPKWTTATFLLDTGACAHFYFCPRLVQLLKKRMYMEGGADDFIKVKMGDKVFNCNVKEDLPSAHQPANVMGLPMLFMLGLKLKQERISRFTFNEEGVATDIGTQELAYI